MLNKCLVLLLALSVSLAEASEVPLRPYNAQYLLLRGDSEVGTGNIQLQPLDQQQWQFSTSSKASIFFLDFTDTETSTFIWNDQHAKPLKFSKRTTTPTRDRFTEQTFDWQAMKETGKNEKRQWQVDLQPGLNDMQTQVLNLQIDLLNNHRPLSYPVSKKGGVKTYEFEVKGEEILDTPLGKLKTIRVERVHDADDDRRTITWFAKDHQYVPVRLQFFEDGDEQGELQIQALQLSSFAN